MSSKKKRIASNRIENSGRWPVRFTRFQIVDEYEFPATNFPEFLFVEKGNFVHTSEEGNQVLSEGAALVIHPGHGHGVKKPSGLVLARVRYLPEWLTREYEIVMRSPGVLGLFFDQSWMRRPRDSHLHVFSTRGADSLRIRAELEYLHGLLHDGRQHEPVARLSLLKLMSLLADEHLRYWRGAPDLVLAPAAVHALDAIESTIARGEIFAPDSLSPGVFTKEDLASAFTSLTGLDFDEYTARRRAFHAAFLLLTTEKTPDEIAATFGWENVGAFSQHFEQIFEIPPEVYRKTFATAGG